MLMCLSGEFLSVDILSNNNEVQSWLGMLINWSSQELISGLIVVINANNNLGFGCCLFLFKYLIKYGKFLVAFIWLG